MKAKSKPVAKKTVADYGVDVSAAPQDAQGRRARQALGRRQGRLDVDELVEKLKALGVAK
jgi:electron transfer flavoprotein beta subunit